MVDAIVLPFFAGTTVVPLGFPLLSPVALHGRATACVPSSLPKFSQGGRLKPAGTPGTPGRQPDVACAKPLDPVLDQLLAQVLLKFALATRGGGLIRSTRLAGERGEPGHIHAGVLNVNVMPMLVLKLALGVRGEQDFALAAFPCVPLGSALDAGGAPLFMQRLGAASGLPVLVALSRPSQHGFQHHNTCMSTSSDAEPCQAGQVACPELPQHSRARSAAQRMLHSFTYFIT